MTQAIVYQSQGGIIILTPTPEALAEWGIDIIAQKDVPFGLQYKIVGADEIPTYRTFRSAWEIDATALTDGVGAESNEFPKKPEPPLVLCEEAPQDAPEEEAPLPEEVHP